MRDGKPRSEIGACHSTTIGRWKAAIKVPLKGNVYTDNSGRYDYNNMQLIGQVGNSARIFKTITAKSVREVRPGVFVYDLGQNITGVPRVHLRTAKLVEEITFRVSEMLVSRFAGIEKQCRR